jgi:hypothetical protein
MPLAREPRGHAAAFGLISVLLVAIGALVALRLRGPEPRPADAPPTEFSAERASTVLRDLLGDGEPHPVGSAANAAVRARIVARLTALGYAPEVRRGFGCSPGGSCATVQNVVARQEGEQPGRAVLVAVHHDSAPAGPGASDDGAGVAAALEIARILKAEGRRRNPVLFLIDDGEEAGLCGAEAFVASDPLVAQGGIGAVVNLEARGTSGPSLMFETSRRGGWLIRTMAAAVQRPATSSLFPFVYERLPNDTDLTVFKRAGLEGVNFSWIGGVSRYHTPLDDLAHQSRRSLQHQGDNALGMVRALADADLAGPRPGGEVVFFDAFAWRIIFWPARMTLPLALLAAAALGLALVTLGRRRQLRARQIGWGGAAVVAALLAAAVAGEGIVLLLRLVGAAPTPWPAFPGAMLVAAVVGAVAVTLALGRACHRRAGTLGLLVGAAGFLSVVSVVLAVTAPALSFLTLVTALVMVGALLVRAATGLASFETLTAAAGATVSAVVLLPHALLFHDAIGITALPVSAALVALVVVPLAALYPAVAGPLRSSVLAVLLGVTLGAVTVAVTRAPFSDTSRQPLNLLRVEDLDAGQSVLAADASAGRLPASLRAAAVWEPARALLPWAPGSFAPVTTTGPARPSGPRLEVADLRPDGPRRHLSLRLLPGAGGVRAGVALDPAAAGRVEALSLGGWTLDPRRCTLRSGWLRVVTRTLPPEGIALELTVTGAEPLAAVIDEQLLGLPDGAGPLAAARGALAQPFHEGDRTVILRRVRLP